MTVTCCCDRRVMGERTAAEGCQTGSEGPASQRIGEGEMSRLGEGLVRNGVRRQLGHGKGREESSGRESSNEVRRSGGSTDGLRSDAEAGKEGVVWNGWRRYDRREMGVGQRYGVVEWGPGV